LGATYWDFDHTIEEAKEEREGMCGGEDKNVRPIMLLFIPV
jgi:hypothetical protein